MKKLILGLPMLLVLGIVGCRMIDSRATADNDSELNAQDNLTGVFSNLIVDVTSEGNKSNKISPEGQELLAAHAAPQATPLNLSIYLEEQGDEYGSPKHDVKLAGLADESSSRTYTIKLGGRHIGPAKRILESQGASSNQRTLPSYAERKPALAGRNNPNSKRSRRVVLVYATNKDTTPVINPTLLAEDATPVINPAPLTEYATPVINPAPLAEYATPVINPAPLAESATPVINPAPLAEETVSVINPAPLAEETVPVINPAPLAEETVPVINSAPLAENATPVFNPAPLTEYATPVINPAPLTEGSIILIDHNRWIIGE